MTVRDEKEIVFETCKLLIRHFRNLLKTKPAKPIGFHTRIFSHMLHPEAEFVSLGQSEKVSAETKNHPEHVVPCAVLITESLALIKEGRLDDEKIASLLAKHWKVATITKEEAHELDVVKGLKSTMPEGWAFESGDTLARLEEADISLITIENE